MMQAGHHRARLASWHRRWELRPRTAGKLLLDQADHPVVVATTAVDDAEAVALAVMEQVEVVTHEFHLKQRLVDGHRPGRVHLLAQDQRAVTLHLDRDETALGFRPAERGLVRIAGPRPRYPVAVYGGGGRQRRGGLQRRRSGR